MSAEVFLLSLSKKRCEAGARGRPANIPASLAVSLPLKRLFYHRSLARPHRRNCFWHYRLHGQLLFFMVSNILKLPLISLSV